MKNKVQIYINFPNYTQTNKFFVGTHCVRPKKIQRKDTRFF